MLKFAQLPASWKEAWLGALSGSAAKNRTKSEASINFRTTAKFKIVYKATQNAAAAAATASVTRAAIQKEHLAISVTGLTHSWPRAESGAMQTQIEMNFNESKL